MVLRPAYTLGGSGGGIAHNQAQMAEILENGLRLSAVWTGSGGALHRRLEGDRV